MDLMTLATLLQAQASSTSCVALDSTVLSADSLAAIETAFVLPTGTVLTLHGVTAADIPAPTAAGVLTIKAGQAAVLGLTSVALELVFTVEGATLQTVIAATMPSGWKCSNSFSGLEVFPFDTLTVINATFVFASAADLTHAWPSEPATVQPLEQGLNLLADVQFSALDTLESLLGLGQNTFKLYGLFAPTVGQPLPVGSLRAPTGLGTVTVGVDPFSLSMTEPVVVISIGLTSQTEPVQPVDLVVEATFQNTLVVSIGIAELAGTLDINSAPLVNSGSLEALIKALPGCANFTDYIPQELAAIFDAAGLQDFSMLCGADGVAMVGLSLATTTPWTVINGLVLESLTLQVADLDPAGPFSMQQVTIAASAGFLPQIFSGMFNFTVSLERSSGAAWAIDTIYGAYVGSIGLGDLVNGLLPGTAAVPAALNDVQFSDFGVTVSGDANDRTHSFSGNVSTVLSLLGCDLSAHFQIAVTQAGSGYHVELGGSMVIADQTFDLSLDLATAGSQLLVTWTDGDGALDFSDVAAALGWDDMPPVPEALDLGLQSASFAYDFSGKLAFTAASTHGTLTFVAFPASAQSGGRLYVFNLDLPLSVSFADLPVIGSEIPPLANITLDALQVTLCSGDLGQEVMETVTALLSLLATPALMTSAFSAGATFAVSLTIAGEQRAFSLPLSNTATPSPAPDLRAVDASGAYRGEAKWFDIGKSLGPVTLRSIGVEYADSTLTFLLDATLAFASLSLSFQSLGLGSGITRFAPQFHLDGIDLSFSDGPVTISGGLLRHRTSVDGDDVVEYDGEVLIQTAGRTLAALGSWATYKGHPSLFVFAFLEEPLGGPAFFFVTGLSAGFGYNRSLTLPARDQVQDFPLLAGLSDPSKIGGAGAAPGTVLATLGPWVSPSPGSYWLAAGIEFTSFELIHSNALIAVEFGVHFELALLGLSRMKLPQAGTTEYAYVELGLEVILDPDDGLFSATAFISPNSFVIDPACHLTGGFAFLLWFGDNPHAGDSVLTIGGYHPLFAKPDWYPDEPRLGFTWQVSDQVTISGNAYFALTPSCVMGGGELDVLFQSGDLSASFNAHGDFLIQWKPFYFYAEVGVSIGVSYKMDFFLFSSTVHAELGADLTLWGPPTGGTVDVHLWVVSFTVSFGPSFGTGKDPLLWADFRALLPRARTLPAPAAAFDKALEADADPLDQICKLTLNRGLQPGSPLTWWIVRSDEFQFTVETTFPLTQLVLNGPASCVTKLAAPALVPANPNAPAGARADGYFVGVRPMNIACTNSVLALSVAPLAGTAGDLLDLNGGWTWQLKTMAVPEALWGAPVAPDATPTASANTLPARLIGMATIAPRMPVPTGLDAIPEVNFSYDPLNEDDEKHLPFPQTPDTAMPQASANSLKIIVATIAQSPAAAIRAGIQDALTGCGFSALPNDDLASLVANVNLNYTSAPMTGSPVASAPPCGARFSRNNAQ